MPNIQRIHSARPIYYCVKKVFRHCVTRKYAKTLPLRGICCRLAGVEPSRALTLALVVILLCWPMAAYAHGTEISLSEVNAVEVVALFDDGAPMAEAQVAVYAPTDQANPWLTGVADAQGRFVFVPDHSIPGQWDVQLRTSGHGDWVYIEIAEGNITTLQGTGGGLTAAQIALMSAAIIWGFIGTALYFMGGTKEESKQAEEVALAS